jgi:hypothetical protein
MAELVLGSLILLNRLQPTAAKKMNSIFQLEKLVGSLGELYGLSDAAHEQREEPSQKKMLNSF